MSPLREALHLIENNKVTGSTLGLAKLILSMYSPDHAFGIGECVRAFDPHTDRLAATMVLYYLENGEDDEVADVGRRILKLFPNLIAISRAAHFAKMSA